MEFNRFEQTIVDQYTNAQFPDPAPEQTADAGGIDGANPEGLPMEAQTSKGMSVTEYLRGLGDTGALIAKGMVQGFMGTPGDVESLVRGVKSMLTRPEDQGKLDAFLSGLQQKTILFNTEDVKQLFDKYAPLGQEQMLSQEFQQSDMGRKILETGGEIIAPGGYMKAVKPVAGAVVSGAKAVAPALAQTVVKGAEALGTPVRMYAIQPEKFAPKVELPKAIQAISSDPNLSIYLPQAERAPSVALRLVKPEIQGTGEKGALTVGDVGRVLEKSQLSINNGKPLDPTKPKDMVKMVDSATAEAQYQMSQPISGATWYEDDVKDAFTLGAKIVPELATDEPLRVMTTAFAASTSYNKRAGENWSVAMRISEGLMKDGKVASRNPENGKLWGGTTGPIMEQQLKLHQYMIDKMGMDKYAEWLLTPHTVKEIAAMKAESGLYKTPGIPGKATDMKMGAFIMGEKGGAFFLNLNGIKETTADKWFTRTYNRHTGTLTTGNVSEQGLIDAPRNESERSIMKSWNRSVADNMGLDEQANQAVLWYYEQSLYFNLGIKSARSESFSDGAKNLLNARGIEFTDAELSAARGGGNAPKVGAESQGAAGAGNPIGLGQVETTAPANSKSVKKSRLAPTKGAE